MKQKLLKTLVAVLAIAAAAAGPVRGQTTYNVTFGGFGNSYMNITVETTLPITFEEIDGYIICPWQVWDGFDGCNNYEFTGVSVTSGGDGKVSVNYVDWSKFTITVTGAFSGPATIHITGIDDNREDISLDVTVSCVVAPTPHTVRMAEGTEDAANWSIASGDASVTGNQVLENVMSGSQVTATYSGTTKKVKSVKAVKYVPPAATVTTAPTATAGIIEANTTTALVNAGAANGGTMMYAVTTTNAQPASTADFSATRPTAEGRTAGTYYVWFYAKADAEHSDSEIAGPVSVTVTSATITVTWNNNDMPGTGSGSSFTKDGVTIASDIDFHDKSFLMGGTFTTTLGNFTKIEVTAPDVDCSGTGWSGNYTKMTWTGTPASSVSFSGNINGNGGNIQFVFTIEPTN